MPNDWVLCSAHHFLFFTLGESLRGMPVLESCGPVYEQRLFRRNNGGIKSPREVEEQNLGQGVHAHKPSTFLPLLTHTPSSFFCLLPHKRGVVAGKPSDILLCIRPCKKLFRCLAHSNQNLLSRIRTFACQKPSRTKCTWISRRTPSDSQATRDLRPPWCGRPSTKKTALMSPRK